MIDLTDVDALIGAEAVDPGGERIGRVEGVHLSQDGRQPLLVALTLRPLDGVTLVPLQDARLVDGVLRLAFDVSAIERAPVVDGDPTDEEQATVLDWFDGRAADGSARIVPVPVGGDEDGADAWPSEPDGVLESRSERTSTV